MKHFTEQINLLVTSILQVPKTKLTGSQEWGLYGTGSDIDILVSMVSWEIVSKILSSHNYVIDEVKSQYTPGSSLRLKGPDPGVKCPINIILLMDKEWKLWADATELMSELLHSDPARKAALHRKEIRCATFEALRAILKYLE